MNRKFTKTQFLYLCKTWGIVLATAIQLLLLVVTPAQAQLVYLNNGRLAYRTYANQGETNSVNKIPDYSWCGYKGGGVTIPTIPTVETVTWQSGDCRQKIQDAIDRVSARTPDANGYRGAVLIAAGAYEVGGPLYINASGVVLRGEGNGVDETVLIATLNQQHVLVNVVGGGSGYAEISGTRVAVTSSYVPTGARTLDVATPNSFAAGNTIVIQKNPNQAWIEEIGMDLGYDPKDKRDESWTPEKRRINWERKITRMIDANTIEIDAPIVDAIQSQWGGANVFKPNLTSRIQNCGVENIRMESNFTSDTAKNHGWVAVEFARSENCWAKGVVAKYFGNTCVHFTRQCKNITVEDCGMIDPKSENTGGNRYSFSVDDGSTGILVQRCFTWGGRHDLVSGSNVPGPNAFVDCVIKASTADIGPHSSWSTGQLYDAIYCGEMRVVNRMYSGSGHGWTGAQILFWNTYSWELDVVVNNANTSRNWVIGGISENANKVGNGYFESWGTHVTPRSLYIQQLQDRLGSTAVNNVTTADQRNNTLRAQLLTRIDQIYNEDKVQPGPGVSIPTPPSNLVATADSPTQITVTWQDNSDNELKFYLQQSTDGTTFTGVTNPPADAESYTVTGLTANTRYWFRVRAENSAGKSVYSNIGDATTPSAISIPTPPSNLVATADSPTQITVTWQDNSDNELKFYLQQSTDGTTFTGVTNPPADAESYTVTGLTANTHYWFRVRAENSAGKSVYSNIDDATTPSATTYYRIKVLNNTNYVLNAASSTLSNGTNVNVYSNSTGNTGQEWQLIDTDSGYVRIASRINTNYVLDCSTTPANGVNVQLWNWVGNSRQQWMLTDIGGGAYKITVRADASKVLDCSTTPANSVNVQMWNYVGNTRQQWILEPVSGGTSSLNSISNLSTERNTSTSEQLTLNFINNEIQYSIPATSFTTLDVYNLNGQRIVQLAKGIRQAGIYTVPTGSYLQRGLYIIQLKAGRESKTLKVIIN